MLPSRRFNGQLALTDFFNDFFENRSLERVANTPAINVAENDTEYRLEIAAPGMCKDDLFFQRYRIRCESGLQQPSLPEHRFVCYRSYFL